MLILAAMITSCVKPEDEPKVIHFSVLSDSYSTFEGYVQPESNDVWYCPPPDNFINVTSVEEMWWHQVAVNKGWIVERNNSFSGSLIANMNYGNYYGPHSFLRRMDDLGQPDVIFVLGGTNDILDGVDLGAFVYGNYTEDQLLTFRPALACLFENLHSLYPQTEVFFMLDMGLGLHTNDTLVTPELSDAFKASVRTIASHCGVACIDLYDITKSWGHPDKDGQASIAAQVITALEAFNY